MNESSSSPEMERELRDLRARAYGPDADIQDDPAALARLAQLEAAHLDAAHRAPSIAEIHDDQPREEPRAVLVSDAPTSPAESPGEPREAPRPVFRSRRAWLAAVAVGVIVTAVYVVTLVTAGPRPDATLGASGIDPSRQVYMLAWYAADAELDHDTLRGYETYRGLEPWAADSMDGAHCLLVIERSSDNLLGVNCAPEGADSIVELGAWPYWGDPYADGLPDGSVIRFHLRGDEVHAFLYRAGDGD